MKKTGLLVIIFSIFLNVSAFAQNITVTVPDTIIADVGEYVNLPLSVGALPSDIRSFEFTLLFDNSVLELDDSYLNSPFTAEDYEINSTSGKVAFSSSQIITGNTTFATVRFLVKDETTVSIAVQDIYFNETIASEAAAYFKLANETPVFTSSPVKNATQDQPYSYTVQATDGDGDPLTFSLTTAPTGMTITQIDDNSAQISWTPAKEHPFLTNKVIIEVNDGIVTAAQQYIIKVANVNDPPVLNVTNQVVNPGDEWNYTIPATDPDNDKMTFYKVSAPPEIGLIQSSGEMWMGAAHTQAYEGQTLNITVKVVDQNNTSDQETFQLRIPLINDPPDVDSINTQNATSGQLFTFQVNATDPDPSGDILTYSISGNPAGMTINSSTGIIEWTPPSSEEGNSYFIIVTVNDGKGGISTRSFSIIIEEAVNQPPVITEIPDQSVTAGEAFSYQVESSDTDGQVVWYGFEGTYPAGMTINSTSGEISWETASTDTGTYVITVKVRDDKGDEGQKSFNLQVKELVLPNQPPVITEIPDQSITAGEVFSYQVEASDTDGQVVWYGFEGTYPPEMTIDSTTGVISWETASTNTGTFVITVKVRDDKGDGAQESFNLQVEELVLPNQPPVITEIPDQSVTAGEVFSYQVEASDTDGQVVWYGFEGTYPLEMTIDSTTGEISWETVSTDTGTYAITVKVRDDKGDGAQESFNLHVEEIVLPNQPPVITEIPDQNVYMNQLFSYSVEANDSDGSVIWYGFDGDVPEDMSIDSLTGIVEWSPDENDVGEYNITIKVVDNRQGSATTTFVLEVLLNVPPVISEIPDSTIFQGQSYTYYIEASDEDEDVLTFYLLSFPEGMNINSQNGLITWFPGFSVSGDFEITIKVEDDKGNSATETFKITVMEKPDDRPPVISYGPFPVGIKNDGVTIKWNTNEVATGLVEFALSDLWADEENRVTVSDTTLTSSHNVEISDLESNSTYKFRVKSTDAAGNESEFSQVYEFTTEKELDQTSPIIVGDVTVLSSEINFAIIQWKTDEFAASIVEYAVDTMFQNENKRVILTNDNLVEDHVILIENLLPGTNYQCRVGSIDGSGNGPTYSSVFEFKTKEEEDLQPPTVVVGPHASGITEKGAVIVWKLDEPASGIVEYGTDTNYGYTLSETAKLLKHEFNLSDLSPNTIYHYRIHSTDLNNNGYTSSDYTFKTKEFADTSPPYILSGPMVIARSMNTAAIQWSTNELSNSLVEFGYDKTVSLGKKLLPDRVLQHDILLTNLEPDKVYYYRAKSTDIAGLSVITDVDSFRTRKEEDTRPPVFVKLPFTSNVTHNTATIEWETDELSNSRVAYGKDLSLGLFVNRNQPVKKHKIVLTNLEFETAYYYQVKSKDLNNNEISTVVGGLYFKTSSAPDISPPVILKGPVVSHRTHNTATIEWETDELSDSKIDYGLTKSFSFSISDAELVLKHKLIITELNENTTYYFSITSKDFNGNVVRTPALKDYKFTTDAGPDNLPPVILERPIVEAKHDKVYIEWKTDEPSNSWVFYQPEDKSQSVEKIGDPNMVTNHKMIITGLDISTNYIFIIISEDYFGNKVSFPETDQFTIGKIMKGLIALQPPGGSGVFQTASTPDEQAPILTSNPVILAKSDNSFTVSWNTDERSNSIIEFGETGELISSMETGENVLNHVITITNLEPSKQYKFRVGSKDIENNGPTKSQMSVVSTEAEIDNVPPKITYSPVILAKTESQGTIFWETDEMSNSLIKFGTDSSNLSRTLENAEMVVEHKVVLTNLISGKKYFYRTGSADLNGNGPNWSLVYTFVTDAAPDVQAPIIIEGSIRAIVSDKSASLQWETDEISDSYIKYGKENTDEFTAGSNELVQYHNITLVNLEPDTDYRFMVGSVDQSGNEISSSLLTFKTFAAPDTVAPLPPDNLKAIAGDNAVFLCWGKNTENDLSGYNVYRKNNEEYELIASSIADTCYLDKSLENNLEYSYCITAVDRVIPPNESNFSDVAKDVPMDTKILESPSLVYPRLNECVNIQPFLQVCNCNNVQCGRCSVCYEFMISTDSLFNNIIAYMTGIKEDETTTMCKMCMELTDKIKYYWKVRGFDGYFYSKWSDLGVFIADASVLVDVKLEEFYGFENGTNIEIIWKTYLEKNNLGFNLYRSNTSNGFYRKLNFDMIIGEQDEYKYIDQSVEVGKTYFYKLEAFGKKSDNISFGPIEITVIGPEKFEIFQNYPNPFNPITNIKFNVPDFSPVKLKVFNILGQEVKTLINEDLKPGYYNIKWDGTNNLGIKVASGLYIYRIVSKRYTKTMKMILMK